MTDSAIRPLPPEPSSPAQNSISSNDFAPSMQSHLNAPPASSPAFERPVEQVAVPIADLRVYSHSGLVYWWPMWLIGYVMAGLTYWKGHQYQIGADTEWFHPSSDLGMCFFVALIAVILITNVSVRGMASGIVILTGALVTVLFAYLGWWDPIFTWLGGVKIHLNFGAYLWFSTLLLTAWTLSVLVFDRLTCWHFKPGQLTQEFMFGSGSKSYDTNGMLLEKHREDLFRHWVLGIGSGDLKISTTGAISEQIEIPNVLFLGSKIKLMQRLIAEEPMV
jgi:hypothetical protein